MKEYVGGFEISVYSFDLMEALEAVDNLFEKEGGLIFSQPLLFVQILLQFSPVAQFHY